jgi:simple sugar transport system substrate-binding protein
LLDAGAIQAIGFWDPRDAGLALNRIARQLLQGQAPSDGMDLGVDGYRNVSVRPGPGRGVVVTGNAAIIVDRKGASAYPF